MLKEARQLLRPIFDGLDAYFVGGCVRDSILNIKPKDIDVVVRCHPEQLLQRGAKHISSATSFPVYLIQVDPIGTIQVALPRTETKKGNGYHGFTTDYGVHIPIEKDLQRRDFTINTMAINIATGHTIDPYNGRKDLEKGMLRHTSDEAFVEDPVRVFRFYRFACKGYTPHPATRTLIQSHNWHDDFALLPVEKVYAELMKAMDERHPERFFSEFVQTGVGKRFLPEVFAMLAVPAGPAKHHPEENLFVHSIETLRKVAQSTPNPTYRLCAFLHDIGKLLTPPHLWPSHHDHHKAGAIQSTETLRRLKAPNKVIKAVAATNSLHMKAARWLNLTHSSKATLCLQASQAGIGNALPLIVKADSNSDMPHWDEVLSISHTTAPKLGIPIEWIKQNTSRPEVIASRIMQQRVNRIRELFPA